MTFVIAIGGIDLSIATTVTLASVMMGLVFTEGWPLVLSSVPLGLLTGAASSAYSMASLSVC